MVNTHILKYMVLLHAIYYPIKYQVFNILRIKRDIDQQDFEIVDLHFV